MILRCGGIRGDGGGWGMLGGEVLFGRDGLDDWSKAHLEQACAAAGRNLVGLGLWGDGVPVNWDGTESVEVLSLNFPGPPPRALPPPLPPPAAPPRPTAPAPAPPLQEGQEVAGAAGAAARHAAAGPAAAAASTAVEAPAEQPHSSPGPRSRWSRHPLLLFIHPPSPTSPTHSYYRILLQRRILISPACAASKSPGW